MADMENYLKNSVTTKKDDFMERYKKFKEERLSRQKAPLKETKTQNISANGQQKRKSLAHSSKDVPKKKPRLVPSVVAQQWRHKKTEISDVIQTAQISQGDANVVKGQKSTVLKDDKANGGGKGKIDKWQIKASLHSTNKPQMGIKQQKRDTPMSVRLERWREEKKKLQPDSMKGNRNTVTSAVTPSTKKTTVAKYLLPAGPKALQGRYSMNPIRPHETDRHRKSLPAQKTTLTQKTTVIANKEKQTSNRTKKTAISDAAVVSKTKTGPGKSILKRRHSEVRPSSTVSPLRRSGILKRKSCIASFSDVPQVTDLSENEISERLGTKAPLNSKPDHGLSTDDDDDIVFKENVKTPDHGRSVRFFSPQIQNVRSKCRRTSRILSESSQQESMRAKLDDWLKAKGKTPSKFRHLMCFDADVEAKKNKDPKTKCSLTVDELTEQQAALDQEDSVPVSLTGKTDTVAKKTEESVQTDPATSHLETILDECTILFEAGCPVDDILQWLDSIEVNIPIAKKSALFYITKARVLQSTADLDRVLQVFEAAVMNAAQPAQELASGLTAIVKEVSNEREEKARSKSLQKQVQKENIFESSSIKYCVRQVTPFIKRSRRSVDSLSTPGSNCQVITPVRRSTRRSLASLPESLHDKTPVYNTLEELSDSDKKRMLYQKNSALQPVMLDFSDSDDSI